MIFQRETSRNKTLYGYYFIKESSYYFSKEGGFMNDPNEQFLYYK